MYNETIKCMICGKETTQINHAHLKTHGLTSVEYREMFPDAKMRIVSDKTREATRQNMIKRNKSKKGRAKSSEMFKGKEKSEEHKLALKEAKAKEDKEKRAKINGDNRRGKPQPEGYVQNMKINYGGVFRGKSGIREDLGIYVRSKWEANYARVLKHKNVNFQFEPKTFFMTREDGSQTSYTPDFYLVDSDLYVEVKGFWMDAAKEKFDLFRQQYPDIRIDVVDGEKYKIYEKHFKDIIEEWE